MKKENERKKEYLRQYARSQKRIDNLKEQLSSLREIEQSVRSQQMSDMPKGSSHDKDLSDLMVKIEKLNEKIKAEMVKSAKTKIAIEEDIFNLQNVNEARVLRMRYIESLQWEEISAKTKYSKRQTLRIHGNALKNFKDVTQCHF